MGSGMWGDLGMSMFGIGQPSDKDAYGSKPTIPELETSAATAIGANKANLKEATELGERVNAANQEQLLGMLRKAIPGFDDIIGKQKSILEGQLKGEIPQDVADAIKRNSAVKSLYGGYGGSGMASNLTARDLGLTSLGITDRALDSASRWMQNLKSLSVPGQFDVTSMFISPQQQFDRDLLAAGVAAAPDPAARGRLERSMIVTSAMMSGGLAAYQSNMNSGGYGNYSGGHNGNTTGAGSYMYDTAGERGF